MKAISLPINVVVILLLAVIVMIGLVFWFMGVVPPTATQTTIDIALRNCCTKWISLGCDDSFKTQNKCAVPESLKGAISGCTTDNFCSINNIADKFGIKDNIEKYCGCP